MYFIGVVSIFNWSFPILRRSLAEFPYTRRVAGRPTFTGDLPPTTPLIGRFDSRTVRVKSHS